MVSTVDVATRPQPAPERECPENVNDFALVAATVNGSGSQTANATLLRALFKMGIPVTGKNLFPSNISGLPTWYTIRVSKDGYTARREKTEILIAFNPTTAESDLAAMPSGGVCIYRNDIRFAARRDDVVYCALPAKEMAKNSGADTKLLDYMANMVYVGAVAELLGIELAEINDALSHHFKGKAKAVALNFGVVEAAAAYTRENMKETIPFRVERMNGTTGKLLIDGNSAAALGAVFGGVTFGAWYPITPSTSVFDALTEYLAYLRRDEATGEATYAIVQSEDELAAIGMVLGAGWAGARAMTATSGPGISLMTEFAGMGFFAEIPAVIWDIMRMGPSTGLPTRVSQGDVLPVYFLGHGDTRQVCLLPGSVAECFRFGWEAFDLAERLQTPVFVLSDLDLGMNFWMTEPFEYPDKPMDRGKVLDAAGVKAAGEFARYRDVDGDGIPYRTLPGNPALGAAYFTRGTGHNDRAVYSERPEDWEQNLARLFKKHDTARGLVPGPVVDQQPGARVGLIAYGSVDPTIVESRDRLRAAGIETSYMRLRALPLNETVREFIAAHEVVYVVELNFDGQMRQLLQLHCPEHAAQLRSVAHCDGLPLTARFVTEAILEQEQKGHRNGHNS
ncbi:MAG: 2-oxoacid:acceptor oxidoreductase subunit alpha [Chloroflexota bacterium]|nr:2-oxoacid:acceptor oxidoreductase subunit alpha [Chloroflexota bacterium]